MAVTALTGGRRAVIALLRRVFHWRLHPGWYLLAIAGIPGLAVAGGLAIGGTELAVLINEPRVVPDYLLSLAFLLLINLWEKTGWTAFVQS